MATREKAAGDDRQSTVLVLSAWEPELRRLRTALGAAPRLARVTETRAVGVGLVEAAIGTARAIADIAPQIVVLVGTAGVYPTTSGELGVGRAMLVRKIKLLSSTAVKGEAYFPRTLPTVVESDADLRKQIARITRLAVVDLACPLGITQTVTTARRTAAATGCSLENLEAFAVARAAVTAEVPFAAVMGISNAVGPAAHAEWEEHADDASAAACDAVLAWLGAEHVE